MFRQNNSTVSTRLLGYRAPTSLYGKPVTIPYGRVRLGPQVIWTGGWEANPVSGGKGNKGKGGAQQYDYIATFLMGLGAGPVPGVYSIWRDRDKFNLADATETYTVPVGGGSYTSAKGGKGNPYWWVLNIGVARQDSLSYTATDYGSPASVSGTTALWTPMQLVPSSPGAGQYTLNVDSSGYAHYGFSAADAGKTVQVTYSYQVNNYSVQGSPMVHLNLILFSGTFGQQPWNSLVSAYPSQALGYSELAYIASPQFDLGSGGVLPGLNFEVQGRFGPPDVTTGSGPGLCDCNPADVIRDILTNPLDGVLGWVTSLGSASVTVPVPTGGNGTVSHGTQDSSLPATEGTSFAATSGSFASLVVGQQISIGTTSTTVVTVTDSTHIIVADPITFASGQSFAWTAVVSTSASQVTGSSIWLPSNSAANGIGSGGQVYKYCSANGLFISIALDQQRTAREVINEILQVANSDAFWSEGVLKFGSYGDTTAVGTLPGGAPVLYSPATQPVYDIDDNSLICGPGEEPVKEQRPDVLDVKNEVVVEWINRSADYATNTLPPARDAASIARVGRRPDSTKSLHGITTQPVAVAVQNTILKRLVYIDGEGKYSLTLPPHFCLLDPMDLLTLTEQYLQFAKKPLRITKIEEDDHLCLKLTLEAFPWSVSAPTLFPSQGHTPSQAGYFADPGLVFTPMFVQMPPQATGGNPFVLGIGLCGSQNWGGAVVYMSTDGEHYDPIGTATGPATMGLLTHDLAVTVDPDTTTHDLQLDLTQSYGELESYSKTQADNFQSLIAVDSELMAYETADLTGVYLYGLTYLRRGLYGTGIAAHAIGAQFAVLDTLYEYEYDASMIGKTVYFKFASVNLAGQREQDLSQVIAYSLTIQAAPPAPSFGVDVSALDPTTALVTGLAFEVGGQNIDPSNFAIAGAVFNFYYTDPGGADWLLAANVGVADSSISLTAAPGSGLTGQYIAIGEEIMLCGTPSGTTVPVTRAQLGTTAATATAGDSVFEVSKVSQTPTFPAGFFSTADAISWQLEQSLANMLLVAVTATVANQYGTSALGTVCLTGNTNHGLLLNASGSSANGTTIVNITNNAGGSYTYTLSAGTQWVNVTATTGDVTIILPPEASCINVVGSQRIGDTITVQLSYGSTHNVIIQPSSGDTDNGSSASFTISTPGGASIFTAQ